MVMGPGSVFLQGCFRVCPRLGTSGLITRLFQPCFPPTFIPWLAFLSCTPPHAGPIPGVFWPPLDSSLVAQAVKRLPTMQQTQVQSLGQEGLLEKEMATHSSTLAWKIPWMEEPGKLQSMGSQRVRHN